MNYLDFTIRDAQLSDAHTYSFEQDSAVIANVYLMVYSCKWQAFVNTVIYWPKIQDSNSTP